MDVSEMALENPVILRLKDLDEGPGPYCMSFGFPLQPLARSIEKFGLINRPIVREGEGGRMDVVAGYRRILALKSLKWKQVPCIDISDSGLSPLQCLLLNLYDNLATRAFNEVEKGMILNRLISHVPKGKILESYMPLLDLPSHESTLDIFLRLEELEHPIRLALIQKRISFRAIKALLEMGPEARLAMAEHISNLKLNFNQQIQFMEYITDISIKEEKRIPELLRDEQISGIRESEKPNDPQKARMLLDLLRHRRFPRLTRSEIAFERTVSSLGLPEGVRIHHPPFFEGADYRLEILFKDGKGLMEKIQSLSGLSGLERVGDPWDEDL